MATQEERLTTVEKSLATFQREMVAKTRETNENSTILLGLPYKQSIEIKDIHERLDTIEQDVRKVKTTQIEHTTLLHQQTALLTQILERLPM